MRNWNHIVREHLAALRLPPKGIDRARRRKLLS
jgi:hypothetical protein